MADFALWGEAIARAMGYEDLEFINAYYENIGKQNIEAVEAHPLGQVIAKYFEETTGDNLEAQILEGSPMEILEILEIFAGRNKINIDHKLWPKSANMLSRRLNQIRSNLLEGLGIDIVISRLTSNKKGSKVNTSHIKIRRISPVSPIPPVSQNHEGNKPENTGDIYNAGGIVSPANQIPPVKSEQNYAQKPENGDTGHTGDILLIPEERHRIAGNLPVMDSCKFDCYYCNFQTNNKDDYERHIVLHHPRKLSYPSKADLEKMSIEGKDKPWEI